MGMQLGYTMMTEQDGPKDLVSHVVGAEAAGFDFAVSSDHYFPWLDEMGHSPNAWVTLGAAAQATSRIPLMTYVTCPTFRYHPVVVAQQAATLQILADGRFTLGLGAGETLNEHVVGGGWPPADVRQPMLVEAIRIIRDLFEGDGYTNFRGQYFDVESAKLWDLPDQRVPIGVAVSGEQSCRIAGELGDVMIAVEPEAELGQRFDAAGGSGKARVGAMAVGLRAGRRGGGAARADPDLLRHRPGGGDRPCAHAVPLVRLRLEGQRRAAGAHRLRRGQPLRAQGGRCAEHPVRGRRRRGHPGGPVLGRRGLHPS